MVFALEFEIVSDTFDQFHGEGDATDGNFVEIVDVGDAFGLLHHFLDLYVCLEQQLVQVFRLVARIVLASFARGMRPPRPMRRLFEQLRLCALYHPVLYECSF